MLIQALPRVFLIVHSLGHPMERTKPKHLRFGDMGFFPAPSLRKWSLEQELEYKWLGSRSQVLDSIRQGRRNPLRNWGSVLLRTLWKNVYNVLQNCPTEGQQERETFDHRPLFQKLWVVPRANLCISRPSQWPLCFRDSPRVLSA